MSDVRRRRRGRGSSTSVSAAGSMSGHDSTGQRSLPCSPIEGARARVVAGLVAVLLVVLGSATGAFAAPAPTPRTAPPVPPPGAWILVDADTGNVIEGSNQHVPMRPASLTKVITA